MSADLNQLPGSPSFVDNINGTGTFSWTPPVGAAPGPYSVTFTATDSADTSLTSSETISIDVAAAPPGGGGGSGAYQPDGDGQFVMEAEHFDATTSAGGRDWVSDFTAGYVGDSAMQSVPDSFSKVTSSLNANSPRLDYEVELAVASTLNVWIRGVGLSGSRDSVWVGVNGNDASATDGSLTRDTYGWTRFGQINLSAGVHTFNVWMREDGSIVDRIFLTPLATVPSGNGPPESPRGGGGSPLPLSDDFADGNADGWTIVDDSILIPSNWAVVNEAFVQSAHTNNNGNDVSESYHRGSYAHWAATAGLTDYRLSVDVTPDAKSGDDIGVMFRYADANNYYRFTLNLLNGFARLETKQNGTYMTLASDHRGYTPGLQHTIVVEAEGPLMQVFVNGDPLFAATSNYHASGGIALFSRDNSTFDNVSLTENGSTPEVVIAAPEAHNVLPGAPLDLDVSAVARNAAATNAGVQFQYYNGGTPTLCDAATEPSPGYYTAQCPGMPAGNYTVEALLLDNGVEVDRDSNFAVAVGSPAFLSHRYDAIGNSITRGDDDYTVSDNLGVSTPLVRSSAGWTALLTDLLVEETGSPNLVGNEGISGDRVTDVWNTRLFSIIERNPESDRALVMLGSNDSNTFNTTSVADYTANLQNIIDELLLSRDTVYVALLPPAWGRNTNPTTIYPDPLAASAERNQNIISYNTAILGLLPQAGVQLGPDFFSCFLTPTVNRFSLFDDPLHPNGLGYQFMAALWRDALMAGPVVAPMDPCPSPIFILEDLDPYTHDLRQTLMEEGNQYYRDASFTLTNIPPELADGIWVQTSNADNANANADFVSFSVGGTSSTVYIAYDPAGSPPTSSTHTFAAASLSEPLTTSDGAVGVFGIVSASSVTGTVTIGGTKSAGSPGAQQAYLVIVVPD
jgi:lysophospholipase L1-like esterase